MFERIPEELQQLQQWHVWRQTEETKIPLQVNGAAAKSNDPKTWTDFTTAADAAQFFSGLAFEVTEPYCGIDLDNCFDDEGKLRSWAWPILSHFDGYGYAEISPSGRGIKILTRARKPAFSKCVHKFGDDKQQIECYDKTRFWAMTGDVYSGNEQIRDGQHVVDWLCETYLSQKKQEDKPKTAPVLPPMPVSDPLIRRAQAYLDTVPGETIGSRNSTGFRLAGHLYAMDDNGRRLQENEVLELLEIWNGRNSEPLPGKELQTLVRSAGVNGTPREKKPDRPMIHEDPYPEINLNRLLGEKRTEDFDDEEFCLSMVPPAGLMRHIYDYYATTSHRTSHAMGLAVAVSLCQTIFGRRITSHTDLRTNDYNVVVAPTTSGKEACETAITRILYAADFQKVPMLPPDVQSGNGLLKAVWSMPCGIWVCDEFGKVLEAILDRKSNNGHAKSIGTHLLKLYSKSSSVYGGAAHADGVRNQIIQPHLCLLGLTTGQIFESMDSRQVKDGLFGRIAFWPVQDRPKRKTARMIDVPDVLAFAVREWIHWEPLGAGGNPIPVTLEMTSEALERWEKHGLDIDAKMERESESRAAIWGRVAARAMKLALVHRAARISDNPAHIDWQFTRVELIDVNWGIHLANWLARISCSLIRENVVDTQAARAKHVLLAAVQKLGAVSRRDLLREFRSISGSEFTAAADTLQADGCLEIVYEETGGRARLVYKRSETQTA